MDKYTVLLDYGHGGMLGNKYMTYPNKMYSYNDGFIIYEGHINRQIGHILEDLLSKEGINYHILTPTVKDTSLSTRVLEANKIYHNNKLCYGISIHSNCASELNKGNGNTAHGFEIWTSPGQTKSDPIGQVIAEQYEDSFHDIAFRKNLEDEDYDKEARLYMCTRTLCPFVLVENLFFDNRKEAEFLSSLNGQTQIAYCLLKGILKVQEKQLLQ